MENNFREILDERIVYKRTHHIDEYELYDEVYYFNDDNIIVREIRIATQLYNWQDYVIRLSQKLSANPFAILNIIYSKKCIEGYTYEQFVALIRAEEKLFQENEKLRVEYEEKRQQCQAKLIKKNQSEQLPKSGKQSKEKSFIEDLIGVCRFEFVTVSSRTKSNKVLDCIRVNFLICEKYASTDIMENKKEILNEVVRQLAENHRFKKYGIPVGCYKAAMFVHRNPKSVTIVFSLKDELIA